MPLTSSSGGLGAVPGRTATRSRWPLTTMLRTVSGAAFRRLMIGIGRITSWAVARRGTGLLPGSHAQARVG